jgi:hypothetical protein
VLVVVSTTGVEVTPTLGVMSPQPMSVPFHGVPASASPGQRSAPVAGSSA